MATVINSSEFPTLTAVPYLYGGCGRDLRDMTCFNNIIDPAVDVAGSTEIIEAFKVYDKARQLIAELFQIEPGRGWDHIP